VKLLRVLETWQFERVGDNQPVRVDVRIISATNKNLNELILKNQFREDLFFRINVIPIHLPPLRDRKEDIPLLINTFIQNLQNRTGKRITGMTPDALKCFMDYPWPGNVRELKSALEYSFVVAEDGLIDIRHLVPQLVGIADDPKSTGTEVEQPPEKIALIEALRQSKGNQTRAARLLGINRVTVWNRMRKYNLDLRKVMQT